VSTWPSARAARVLAALLRIGWSVKRQRGSHATLQRGGWPDFVWAFHDGEELGPKMLARLAKRTGLVPEDL
jgi:predicted RNA binding protein YcfA (HicA-like mRNA interferase family)